MQPEVSTVSTAMQMRVRRNAQSVKMIIQWYRQLTYLSLANSTLDSITAIPHSPVRVCRYSAIPSFAAEMLCERNEEATAVNSWDPGPGERI